MRRQYHVEGIMLSHIIEAVFSDAISLRKVRASSCLS